MSADPFNQAGPPDDAAPADLPPSPAEEPDAATTSATQAEPPPGLESPVFEPATVAEASADDLPGGADGAAAPISLAPTPVERAQQTIRNLGERLGERASRGRAVLALRAGEAWRRSRETAARIRHGAGKAARELSAWAKQEGAEFSRELTRRRGGKLRPWRALGYAAVFSGVFLFAAGAAFSVYVTWGMPSPNDVWTASANPSFTFKDRSGLAVLREGAQNAPPVKLDALPPYVANAVIAIEDRRFRDHIGVDVEGLARAGVENIQAGRVVQGGSTLTQQLAKNLFLTNERTFRRKAQEVVLALWLESRFTKDELLALYLSRVYFGAGAWGVEAAAERYFDKPAHKMTLGEAALLAGLLKAPSRLNPAAGDEAAKERAAVVLDAMVAEGFVTPQERAAALEAPLSIRSANPAGDIGYFRTWIETDLNRIIGDERGDFVIETTIDLTAQRAAERAVDTVLAKEGEALNVRQAALISLDEDGGVRAMVGGRGFSDSQFNRATQARRQPGSAFKFFIYLAAMEQGLSPYAIRIDRPLTIGDWSPGNYEDKYFGPVQLVSAFARSLNMVAIELALEVGGDNVIEVATRLGVRSPLANYRSLALGSQEMTLMEISAAYGAMASGGYKIVPHGITRITRAESGEVIWERAAARERVIEDAPLRLMNLMMKRVVDSGTATRARLDGWDAGGKTGTGNDYRDAWFVGFVPGLVTGVWAGNDDFTKTRRVTGGSIPAQIWKEYMAVATRGVENRRLLMPRPQDFPIAQIEELAPELMQAPMVELPIGPPGELDDMRVLGPSAG